MRNVFLFLLIVTVGGCAPLGMDSTGGTCTTSEGGQVNTYQIFGKWKKRSPYTPPRSDDELALNFDLLIVERGAVSGTTTTPLCMAQVVNGGLVQVLYRGIYEHDLTNKKMLIQYLQGDVSLVNQIRTATYSFSGSCDSTTLNLAYSDGKTELFDFFSQPEGGPSGDCNPQ